MYHPLDVLSGDAYSARRINKNISFYLIVDGMGKGLSASLTAMIMTSFVNHIIDKMIALDQFDLAILVHETTEYIKPILLEDEALALDYIVMDNEEDMLYYSKFAMPVILMQNSKNELIKLKSNNPPLSKWSKSFNIDKYNTSDTHKFLFYSDGVVENETKFKDKLYYDFIDEDFLNSFTREDLKKSFFQKIDNQEDDITFIYIHQLSAVSKEIATNSFKTSMDELERAGEWYEKVWNDLLEGDGEDTYSPSLVFTELIMNAYEHGNLKIDSHLKHKLLYDNAYIETLLEKEKSCDKKIVVKITATLHNNSNYIMTQIIDEGDGFDTTELSQIFRHSQTFNGRGVFMSRKNSLGIYYNSKGNEVLYLHKI